MKEASGPPPDPRLLEMYEKDSRPLEILDTKTGPDYELGVEIDGHPYDLDWRDGRWSAWVGCIDVAHNFRGRDELVNAIRASKPLFDARFATDFRDWDYHGDTLNCADLGIPWRGPESTAWPIFALAADAIKRLSTTIHHQRHDSVAPVQSVPPPDEDYVTLRISRGEARGIVELLENTVLRSAGRVDKPMIVLDIARRLEGALGEPRPYPRMPR